MDLHDRLLHQAVRHVRTASLAAFILGALSLAVAVRSWRERGYIDFQIIFGIADAVVVLGLAAVLRRGSIIAAVALLALGVAGIGYGVREGVPLIAAVPTVIGIGYYARALSALRFIRASESGRPT